MLGEHNYSTYQVQTKLDKVKVSVNELEVGMYVAELDRPWTETPFLFQGFIISSVDEIEQLADHCEHVYIDVHTKSIKHKHDDTKKAVKIQRKVHAAPSAKKFSRANDNYTKTKKTVDRVLTSIKLQKSIDTRQVSEAVTDCIDSLTEDPNALLWLTQIKNKDDYTAEHCVRVAILAVAIGRELDMVDQELHDLGMAAMLHDVGKVLVPDEILNKEGSLTSEEYEIMKKHSEDGQKILMAKANVPPVTVDVAYSHHERIDGKGYPRGISGDKIPKFAKIVSIVDAYDAITSDRVYSKGRSTLEALRILYDCKGSQFDEELVNIFVGLIGIYPPGQIAELSNGEVGIILSCPPKNKLRPRLLIVRGQDKKLCRERVIDLAKPLKDNNGRPLQVKEVHTDGAFSIQLNEYKAKGLKYDLV